MLTLSSAETLNAIELAEFLKVSVGYVYNIRAQEPENDNKLPKGHKVGRHVIWLKSEVLEWIRQH